MKILFKSSFIKSSSVVFIQNSSIIFPENILFKSFFDILYFIIFYYFYFFSEKLWLCLDYFSFKKCLDSCQYFSVIVIPNSSIISQISLNSVCFYTKLISYIKSSSQVKILCKKHQFICFKNIFCSIK